MIGFELLFTIIRLPSLVAKQNSDLPNRVKPGLFNINCKLKKCLTRDGRRFAVF
ncbi:MAG: hypothetical protein PHH26_08180 [Candidatus Thermoplasmatota archaeon]|nr:hypothetical protein [Candidatus Thermoplasmatota archaeon]